MNVAFLNLHGLRQHGGAFSITRMAEDVGPGVGVHVADDGSGNLVDRRNLRTAAHALQFSSVLSLPHLLDEFVPRLVAAE
jgi:hypothetical protein